MSGWRAVPRQYPVQLRRALDLLLLRRHLPQQLELPAPGAGAGPLGRLLGVHRSGGHRPRVLHHLRAGDQAPDPGGDRETLQVRPHPAHPLLENLIHLCLLSESDSWTAFFTPIKPLPGAVASNGCLVGGEPSVPDQENHL